jgi:hypothetical protein
VIASPRIKVVIEGIIISPALLQISAFDRITKVTHRLCHRDLVARLAKREFDAKLQSSNGLITVQRQHQVANDFGARRMGFVQFFKFEYANRKRLSAGRGRGDASDGVAPPNFAEWRVHLPLLGLPTRRLPHKHHEASGRRVPDEVPIVRRKIMVGESRVGAMRRSDAGKFRNERTIKPAAPQNQAQPVV